MEDEQFKTLRTTFSNASNHSTNQRQASYATERAKLLFAGYRRGDANDPDGYVASIAAVLAMYEPELIRRVTDPRTGISTTEKFCSFMPNSGELKVYCDQQQAVALRLKHYSRLPPPEPRILPPPPHPGQRANLFVSVHAPQYAALCARAEKHVDPLDFVFVQGGIRVPVSWINGVPRFGIPAVKGEREQHTETAASVRDRLGLSEADWAAIPDAPPPDAWQQLMAKHTKADQ